MALSLRVGKKEKIKVSQSSEDCNRIKYLSNTKHQKKKPINTIYKKWYIKKICNLHNEVNHIRKKKNK